MLCKPKPHFHFHMMMNIIFKPPFAALFFLVFFSMLNFFHGNPSILCPVPENEALITFKHSLKNFSSQLSSWSTEVDCCKWNGVVCDNLTGHVRELRLSGYELSGKLHPSLLSLKYLTYLDLRFNNFNETIPSFIGSFTSLEVLDLDSAGFYGIVPHTIGNLSNLYALRLVSSFPELIVDNLQWLSSLPQMEYLIMDRVNLTKATSWAHMVNTLPSLLMLSLTGCDLDFKTPFDNNNISTSLTVLDLRANTNPSSYNVVPSWIFQLSNLTSLDLRSNNFEGPLPSISNATKLQNIYLGYNHFKSSIPNWFYSCKDLVQVDIYVNHLQNKISNDIQNLTSLKFLLLAGNELSGNLPDSLGNVSNLESLDLGINQFYGAIPTSIGKLSLLKSLNLEHNKLIGNLPESIGQIFNMEQFTCGNNMLEGVVTEKHFANLTRLKGFVASGNHLTLKVNPNWDPPFKLKTLKLGSWKVGTSIPSWIQTHTSITQLDLSKTGISGTVPNWLWKILFLDLSHNQFHGRIPDIMFDQESPPFPSFLSASHVNLSSNQFSGSLPRVTNVEVLDLSNNLLSGEVSPFLCRANPTNSMRVLHLGYNELSGVLPDCWMNWRSLMALHLENNNITGSVPSSLGLLTDLQSLDLHKNKISGHIPISMLNCTNLWKIDISYNDLQGNIPKEVETSLPSLMILILRSNKLSGELSSDICYLSSLQVLDLSNNNFFGRLPGCIGNFTGMVSSSAAQISLNRFLHSPFSTFFIESANIHTKGRELQYDTILTLVTNIDLSRNNFSGSIPEEMASLVELRSLNLSENHLTGSIPNNIGDIKQLESLDLSRNSLSGEIPDGFKALSFLSYLDLSYNNLTGRIPDCTQLRGLDPSSFMGNNLCGPPLTSNCSDDGHHVQSVSHRVDKEDDKLLLMFISLGYVVGFSAICAP